MTLLCKLYKLTAFAPFMLVCVCVRENDRVFRLDVCVCLRERERERQRETD